MTRPLKPGQRGKFDSGTFSGRAHQRQQYRRGGHEVIAVPHQRAGTEEERKQVHQHQRAGAQHRPSSAPDCPRQHKQEHPRVRGGMDERGQAGDALVVVL